MKTVLAVVFFCAAAMPVHADFTRVDNGDDFRAIITGKVLTRPLVRLKVSPSGTIQGTGAAWDVTGSWSWRDGFFCRDLFWGGDPLGYNCQEVRVKGERIRFTADRGSGESAVFRLRD